MPAWSLVAAGHTTDDDTTTLTQQIVAMLTQPANGTRLSSLHIDTVPPVRITPHLS